jgi:hypothetical protein
VERALSAKRGIVSAVLVAATAVFGVLVTSIEIRRTGDQGLAPMTFAQENVAFPGRLWIDTDAA